MVLSSVSSEHQRAVNELHNQFAMTRSAVKYPKTVAKAVLWLSQYKLVNTTLGTPRYNQFAQLEDVEQLV